MHKGDRIRELVLRLLDSAESPLETQEIVTLVQSEIPACTRTIVFNRLTELRGEGEIEGKYLGSGKGVWIWWKTRPAAQRLPEAKHAVIVGKILDVLNNSTAPLETKEVEALVRHAIPSTRAIILRRLSDLRNDGAVKGKSVGSGKGVWIWWTGQTMSRAAAPSISDEAVVTKILGVIDSADAPLETKEVEVLVRHAIPGTRAIILRRLAELRGEGRIKGERVGSGKGVWIWWSSQAFAKTAAPSIIKEEILSKIVEILSEVNAPLETKRVEDLVCNAIPESTRAIVLKRLSDLRKDGAILGKRVGSGKGVWIWWRENAFER